MWKKEPLCTVGEDINWYSHYEKQYGVLKNLKIELPYDQQLHS